MSKRPRYKTIDLCAGIGGIRRGFEMTGRYVNVLSAEIDKYACQTYERLFGVNPFNDLTSEDFKKKVASVEYDVLLAGFPCQTFSRVGLQKGFNDEEKGQIFFHISGIIRSNRPKAIFLENVDRLITHDEGKTFEKIIDVLVNDLDYHVVGVDRDDNGQIRYGKDSFIRNSRFFGMPQNRPRTYIVCFDKKRYDDKVKKAVPVATPDKGSMMVYENLDGLLSHDVDDKYYLSSGYWNTLKEHRKRQEKKGYGYGYRIVNMPDDGVHIANTILATGGSGKERNLLIDYKDGVSGKSIVGKKTPLNDEYVRVMTPTEWGKLQGFINYGFIDKGGKDQFEFPEGMSDAQKYKQFGNSVTIPVIKEFAVFIDRCLKKLEES